MNNIFTDIFTKQKTPIAALKNKKVLISMEEMDRLAKPKYFGELLMERGYLHYIGVQYLLERQEEFTKMGIQKPLGEIAIEEGVVTEERVAEVLSYIQKVKIHTINEIPQIILDNPKLDESKMIAHRVVLVSIDASKKKLTCVCEFGHQEQADKFLFTIFPGYKVDKIFILDGFIPKLVDKWRNELHV